MARRRSLPGEQLSPIEIPYQLIPGTRGQRYFNVRTGASISRTGMLNQVANKYGFRTYNDYLQFSRSLGGIGGLTNENRPRPYDLSRAYALARKWEKDNGLPVGSFGQMAPPNLKQAMNLYINARGGRNSDYFLIRVLDRFKVHGVSLRDMNTARYALGETPRRRKR